MSKISIIVPCYNQAQYLDACLQSVQDQTYENWECLVLNDGSTDHTGEIAKNWAKRDARFIYFEHKNQGVSATRNIGLSKATGDFIQFLDGDDMLFPTKLEKSISLSKNHDVIFTEFVILKNHQYYPGYNKLKKEYFSFESVLLGWELIFTIPIHTALISQKLLKHFCFDTSLLCFEDWLMWLHVLKQTDRVGFIDEELVAYRKEDHTKTASSNLDLVSLERIKALKKMKGIYGEKHHDEICYAIISKKSIENLALKKELNKINNEKIISKYLQVKKNIYRLIK